MWGIYNNELETLLVTIEDLREELHHTVSQGKSILDPFVIKLSQDLDKQLNKYYRMMNDQIMRKNQFSGFL